MTIIKGQLAIANINVSVNNWEARSYDQLTGQLLGSTDVVSSVYYPADWVLPCGNTLGTTQVTITPKAGKYWQTSYSPAENELCVASSSENLFIYKAIDTPQVLKDLLWDNVVIKMTMEGDYVDEKEHAITLGGDAPNTYDQPWYNPTNDDGEFIGAGYVDFSPAATPNHLIIESVDVEAGTDDFCIEFWASAGYGDGSGYLLSLGNPSESTGIGIRYDYGAGTLTLVHNDSDLANISWPAYDWRFFTLTRSDGTATLWRNGEPLATASLSASLSGDMAIGGRIGTSPDQALITFVDFRYTLGTPRYTEAFGTPQAMNTTYGPASTGVAEPEWPITLSSTVEDGDVTWQCMSRMVQPITHGWFKPERNTASTDALSANVVLLVPFSSDSWDLKSSTLWKDWPTFSMDYSITPPPGGYGCGRFNGGNAITDNLDYEGLIYKADSSCDLGTGDFTIEFWIKVTNATQIGNSYQTPAVFELGWSGESGGIKVEYTALAENEQFLVYIFRDFVRGYSIPVEMLEGTTETDWLHIAVSRQTGMARTFLNGEQVEEFEYTDDLHANNTYVNRPTFSIGGTVDTQGTFDGYMADVRVTKGVARYWSTFTPPTARFSD